MKFQMSFGVINLLSDHLAEVIIDEGVVMSLEMCEEYDEFLLNMFDRPFGLLINKLNNYSYTFEAKLHIASLEFLKVMAVVHYNSEAQAQTQSVLDQRRQDNWHLKQFCGLQLGREQALQWLETEMSNIHDQNQSANSLDYG
ncbi:hypothetical protein E2K93_09935 [Thalassotalea sp. HSM 43]|uniref:hypothetical protein n=1 Tax=Thalassotalea sp. HSM 43 TaxID=2552945 RepID=UPI00108069F2|nr:hypothetical protein [Thalassotalea sp. HSM 43]QBY04690.1 hypothetical protein E2K93_09935 [Thalassotalea sp. HSM 43]